MDPEAWIKSFGPFDEAGDPVPIDELPITQALRDRRPAHANFTIRSTDGRHHDIAASGMPMVSAEHGASGAIIFFWPLDDEVARDITTGRHEAVK